MPTPRGEPRGKDDARAGQRYEGARVDMITSVHLQDFKGHRDTQIPLGRLTALVGPNGAGKTSVLEALWLQSQLVEREPSEVLHGDWSPGDLQRRGATGAMILASTGTSEIKTWSARLEIKGRYPEGMGSQVILEWLPGDGSAPYKGLLTHPPKSSGISIAERVGPATLYKLNARSIAAAAYSDWPGPDVAYDGTNTAVALAAIKLGHDEEFDRIEEEMRRLIPNIERVRLRQVKVQRSAPHDPRVEEEVVGSKVFFDFRGAPGVPAHAASEGTLIVLALLTVLHGPNRPRVLLLDDFAQALHPEAQMELVRLIKRLLEEFEDLQIVATTHSPYILDDLDPADVHAFALRDDGTVAVKRLSEHPQAESMKGALTAGQLWSLDPERSWVLRQEAP
jgi:predicted ATPase